jgi:hypothetical protein
MMKNIWFIIFFCTLFSCNRRSVIQNPDALYVIDIDKLVKQDTVYISSFFDSVRTIILEETEDVVIGEVRAIQICEDYIFVLDTWKAKKLFVFDKNGKYVRHVGRIGQGPGEYLGIMDFCINLDSREIYLLDDWKKKIHKYSFDNGNYMGYIDLPKDVSFVFIAYNQDKLYAKIRYYDQKQGDNLLLKIDCKTGKLTEHLSADNYNLGWNRNSFMDNSFFLTRDDSLKYAELLMNTVYSISYDSIYPYLTLKSKDWVQKTDFPAEYDDEKFRASDIRYAYCIHNYFEHHNFIYLQYRYRDKIYSVVYDKKTNEASVYNSLQNDLVISEGYWNTKFGYVGSKAYECFMIGRLIKNEKKLAVNPDKREELMNLDKERFVIFEYEFK